MGFFGDRTPAGKKKVILVAGTFITAIANTLALLLIAREMGPGILGSLGFMLSFIGLVFFVGDMGNTFAFTRLLDKGYGFRECYSGYILAKIKLTVVLGIVSGVLIGVYAYLLDPTEHTPVHPMSMVMILGYFLLANMAQIWVVSIGIKKKDTTSRTYDILESIIKVILVAAIIGLGFTQGDQIAVLELSVIYLLTAIVGLMVVRNAARHIKRTPVTDEIILAFNETSKQLIPYVAMGALVLNLDKVLLWYFSDSSIWTNFEELGLYFGAQRITIFIAASSFAIQGLVGEAIKKSLKGGDKQSVSDTLRMTERYITLMALPVAAYYIFFSHELLVAFLGNDFAGAHIAVGLLAAAGLFTALASPHVIYLIKDEKFKALTISTGLALLTLLLLLLGLLPVQILPFGAEAYSLNTTALALCLSTVVGFVSYRMYTVRLLGCRPHPRILAHVFCAGIMVVVLEFIGWFLGITHEFTRALLFAVLGVFIYGFALYLAGEFLSRDYKKFKELTMED
jgi:O-antigen/teichoic acid export membrane protein